MMAKQKGNSHGDHEVADLENDAEDKETGHVSGTDTATQTQPQHFRGMEAPDAQAIVTGVCGETMGIYLRLNGRTIQEATFLSNGCTPAVAYANLLTTMVQGLPLGKAKRIKPEDLISELNRSLKDHDHCAKLAVNTLCKAIADWDGEDKRCREQQTEKSPR